MLLATRQTQRNAPHHTNTKNIRQRKQWDGKPNPKLNQERTLFVVRIPFSEHTSNLVHRTRDYTGAERNAVHRMPHRAMTSYPKATHTHSHFPHKISSLPAAPLTNAKKKPTTDNPQKRREIELWELYQRGFLINIMDIITEYRRQIII